MADGSRRPPHWQAYAAEAVGTALLVFVGLSVVIFDFAPHSPMQRLLPDPWALRFCTGFLFGSTGALIALSPLGKLSGAHLDPVLSGAFWLLGSLGGTDAVGYVVAQFVGAAVGALPLPLIWGRAGGAVAYGMSLPAPGPPWLPLAGEALTTLMLVGGIVLFVGRPRLRPYTPALLPPLVALLVAIEAPLSGTSMNPARSFGPAIVSHALGVLWIYLLGPAFGAALAALLAVEGHRVYVAKLAHHAHDPRQRFHGSAQASLALSARRRTRRDRR